MSYVGALKALEELDVEFRGFAGSSVGAVFAALYGIGTTTEELKACFMDVSLDLFKDINFHFGKDFSLSKGELFLEWMRGLIRRKIDKEKVTFEDVDKDIIILSVDLTNGKYCEFSRHVTPDVEIAQAVRASVSMPGLFKPVRYNGNWVVDGDLMQGKPLWRSSKNLCPPDARILEFRLEDFEGNHKINNSLDYLNVVYNTLQGFANDFIIDLYKGRDKFDYIKINCKDVSVVDFTISKKRKEELVSVGYDATINYFKVFYMQKRGMLYKNYYEIYLLLLKIKEEILHMHYVNAQTTFGALFIHLCENKQFIDLLIYRQILEFKDIFMNNFKISRFWHIPSLDERELIFEKLEEILAELSEKIEELKL